MSLITSTSPTMSSLEIAGLVRSRHDKVKQSIERLVERGTISQPPVGDGPRSANGVVVQEYHVCKRDSFIVVAQLSPEFTAALVDRWQELEDQSARPMTQAEITAANANHLVEMERQQREQQVAIDRIERRVEVIAEQRVWDHCPQNCIPLGRIQAEMNKTYGLSGPMVSFVLRQWPNQPNHAGMVRNGHEEAKGSQYIVWSKSLVTAAFKRFISECQMVSATQATHPYFEGRFRLVHKVKS
ncbi:Rha family transcriptional regulator [Pseudomonas syringae]|uniref:Rha family transcriptional regulator n=1 Tax=Pseudomonas syringae TaxID=317 RepID=UPI0005173DA0|nr:Rha family transcriptional regulator [Pseudomonas syringae]